MKPPKTPEEWDSESFRVGEHVETGASGTLGEGVEACAPSPPHARPRASLHVAVAAYPAMPLSKEAVAW